jgi:hypothetical protein
MLMKIPDKLMGVLQRQKLTAQKHSPHILFAAGLVGIGTSVVLACRATLKVGDKLDDISRNVDRVKQDAIQPRLSLYENSSRIEIAKRDMAFVYLRGTVEIGRLYAPAIIIGGLSIAALTGSHVQLTRRNTALTGMYATLQKAVDAYRERVRKELGEEKENEIWHAGDFEVERSADGTVVRSKLGQCGTNMYARVFDEDNRNWVPNYESNRVFLEGIQNACMHRLVRDRYLMLNDAYDALGFDRTVEGQLVGWTYPSKSPTGDNYVDFGLYTHSDNADFILGTGQRAIYLDFNVDGVVFDLIKEV